LCREGPQRGPRIQVVKHQLLGLLCSPFATQGRSYKGPRTGQAAQEAQMKDNPGTSWPQEPAWTRST